MNSAGIQIRLSDSSIRVINHYWQRGGGYVNKRRKLDTEIQMRIGIMKLPSKKLNKVLRKSKENYVRTAQVGNNF